ncbi:MULTISPECIES: hypothetical protein [unclassified Pseudomonas]|jgi:hypothetical protein|uniref:hypothetical protein n=1 Tax=unclassified Pseudomonas TaxID=196821 RepID=UPI0008AD61E8|nr:MULTISPECIES: hypothetical protein [unclassified Pseudomonas]QZP22846.1 hypothetical protein K5K89_09005 [Pseudomonas sp. DR208]SEU04317.1 hypothetical protein SAMN03159512_04735 [Pseudomonas sp. NFR09]
MSKTKSDSQDEAGPGRVFRDTLFTSRTLVLPDGSTLAVTKARVTATTDDQLAFLKAHPDLVQE